MIAAPYSSGNRLLDALSPSDMEGLEGDLAIVALKPHQSTQSVGGLMTHVDFPIDAVLSVVATLRSGETVEVGTVGSESFVASDAAFESHTASRTAFCQVRGTVGRMSLERFTQRMDASPAFATLVRHNLRATLFSAQQFAACNAKHAALLRCARWLAMTADRVMRSDFTLTHDFLAIMLGVPNRVVLEATVELEARGIIRYRAGMISIVDAASLEAVACECYGLCKTSFAEALRP